MATSSSSLASHRLKYDVFLNFRGEDTRRGFTSHLYAALCRKALQTFFDGDDLKRGEEIAESLSQAIQESAVAILVFSKNYASSRWCLDELADIIDCHHSHGQIVIPIFYEIDPSHLKKQSDDVAAAFVKHKQNSVNADKIERWKKALNTATNLSGFDSRNFGNDLMLIKEIVEDIFKKLNQSMTCDDFGDLVGMDSRIEEIKRVFTIDPCKINILGIWGMGGVGKTTTAEVIYDIMSPEFEGCCFVHNVRQRAEAIGLRNLLEELVSKALGGENPVKNMFSGGLRRFLKKIFYCKKMLIFLDDVNDPLQLDYLVGDPCWFGIGSMIVVTTRNKQVFGGRNDFIYKVEPLNYYDALQLFNKSAFNQKYPRHYASFSKLFVKYAQGNPLALKVLGSTLNGKNQNEWKGALSQLSKVQNKDIQQVLQTSYNGLTTMEQDVFLDIACFFKHAGQIYVNEDILRKIYKNRGFDIDITLSVLIDKCLVTSIYPLEMHDLLQEMGKEIVRQEAKYPYQRSRLWDPEDIYEVFAGNKEAEAVETIALDLSKIREINLNPQVFMKMPNLRFLNFYGESNLHLSQGLNYLPNTLQYLRWDKYPLESFPPSFHLELEKLVVLELPNSNIKQSWNRVKGNFLVPNSRSEFLETLEVLDLRGCSNLNTFPEISSNMKELNLSKTAIGQIPLSSVECLSKLEHLFMKNCRKLESLPSNFFSNLKSLLRLDIRGCSSFKVFPEILEPTGNTVSLHLREIAIKKLPSFISNLKWLNLNKIAIRQMPSSVESLSNFFSNLTSLSVLGLSLLRNYTSSQMQETLVIYSGSTMPKWVKYQSMGDSIQIHLPSHWLNHLFLVFAFYQWLDNQQYQANNRYDCYFGDNYHFSFDHSEALYVEGVDKEHMVVFASKRFCEWVRRYFDFEEDVAFFKFRPLENEIKKCEVIPLYAQKDEDEFCGTFDFPNLRVSKLKRSATGAGSFHCMPKKRLKIEDIK